MKRRERRQRDGGGLEWGRTRESESERKDILKINWSNSDTPLPLNKYGRGE